MKIPSCDGWDPEAKRCGGDPTGGVVVTLMERVPDALAIDAELRVGEHPTRDRSARPRLR